MTMSATEKRLHHWRSKTIDGFARAELAVCTILRQANLPVKGEVLSARIERLRKAASTAPLLRFHTAQIELVADELERLLPLRNDIVHAPMVIRTIGEQTTACFTNPATYCEFSQFTRERPEPSFQSLAARAAHMASRLEAMCQPEAAKAVIVSRASSPPPPLPVAAGGP